MTTFIVWLNLTIDMMEKTHPMDFNFKISATALFDCEEGMDKKEIHKKAYDEITEKLDALDVAGISLQNTLNELTKQNHNVQKEHSDIQQKYHMENSRLNSLKNMTERYEGFGQSIKHVMERKGDTPGNNRCSCRHHTCKKEYEIAVETALGGSIQKHCNRQ